MCVLFSFNSLFCQDYSSANKKAIKTYEEAVSKFHLRYFGESLDLLDKVIKKDNGFVEAYGLRSVIYSQQNQYFKAIMELETGLNVNPDFLPYLHLDLAGCTLKLNNIQKGKSEQLYILINTIRKLN